MNNYMIYIEEPSRNKDINLKFIGDCYSTSINNVFNRCDYINHAINEYPIEYFFNELKKELQTGHQLSSVSKEEIEMLINKIYDYKDSCSYIMAMRY